MDIELRDIQVSSRTRQAQYQEGQKICLRLLARRRVSSARLWPRVADRSLQCLIAKSSMPRRQICWAIRFACCLQDRKNEGGRILCLTACSLVGSIFMMFTALACNARLIATGGFCPDNSDAVYSHDFPKNYSRNALVKCPVSRVLCLAQSAISLSLYSVSCHRGSQQQACRSIFCCLLVNYVLP